MIASVTGLLLGFLIGVGCRWFDLPLPAPPRIVGALLVVFMTLGFLGADTVLDERPDGLIGGIGHLGVWPQARTDRQAPVSALDDG